MKNLLKNNKFLYKIYRKVFSFIMNFLKIFIRVNDKVILINSFAGRMYNDSPKKIFEAMIQDGYFEDYKIYWNLDNIKGVKLDGAKVVKTNTFKYFKIALKAKYWITNSSVERGLVFKNKKTIYINTWHGTPIKKMGRDISASNYKFATSKYDYICAQSTYDVNIFSHAFNIPKEKFLSIGLPRNDDLFCVKQEEIDLIKTNLNIPLNKKVIMYAPTFREFDREAGECLIAPPINLDYWKDQLGEDFVVIFRAHYAVSKIMNIVENEFLLELSKYEEINDLFKISDILISDYSSLMIDYSILERPIMCFPYDYDIYTQKRGMYIDVKEKFKDSIYFNEIDLIEGIKSIDYNKQINLTKEIKKEYIEYGSNASKEILNIIKK